MTGRQGSGIQETKYENSYHIYCHKSHLWDFPFHPVICFFIKVSDSMYYAIWTTKKAESLNF